MKLLYTAVLIFSIFLAITNSDTISKRQKIPIIENTCLIINQTRTYTGLSFYEWFHSNWNPPVSCANYFLTVSETVFSRQICVLFLSIDERVVSTLTLNSSNDLEQIGMQEIEKIRFFLVHPDALDNQIVDSPQ
jgi:hypothetical protein